MFKIYQLNITKKIKKDYKTKKLVKDVKIVQRKKKKKRKNMVVKVTKNLSEDEKRKLTEHRTKNYRMRENALL